MQNNNNNNWNSETDDDTEEYYPSDDEKDFGGIDKEKNSNSLSKRLVFSMTLRCIYEKKFGSLVSTDVECAFNSILVALSEQMNDENCNAHEFFQNHVLPLINEQVKIRTSLKVKFLTHPKKTYKLCGLCMDSGRESFFFTSTNVRNAYHLIYDILISSDRHLRQTLEKQLLSLQIN